MPAPPLDRYVDDIYCLTGVPRHRRMNVPPMPSAHLFVNLGDPARLWDCDPSVRVPEGKVVKNRVHLDVRVGTGLVGEQRVAALEAECARLIPLGAVRVRLLVADEENESCLVMQDIEGNEFCLD